MTTLCVPMQYSNPFFLPTDRGVSNGARAHKMHVEKMLGDCSQSAVVNADEGLQSLLSIREECAAENWDGYGAQPMDPDSFNEAVRFVRALPTTIPDPDVSVDPDGEISIEWHLEPRRVFSVSIGMRNEITYAGLFGLNKTYGREYFGDEIPKEVFHNLDRLFS